MKHFILELVYVSLADVFLGMFMMSVGDVLPSGGFLVEMSQAVSSAMGMGSGAPTPIIVKQDMIIIDKIPIAWTKDYSEITTELKKLQAAGVKKVEVFGQPEIKHSRMMTVYRLCVSAGLKLKLSGEVPE